MALEDESSDSDNEEILDMKNEADDIEEDKIVNDKHSDNTSKTKTAASKNKSDLDWLKGKVTKTKVHKCLLYWYTDTEENLLIQ